MVAYGRDPHRIQGTLDGRTRVQKIDRKVQADGLKDNRCLSESIVTKRKLSLLKDEIVCESAI